MFDIGFSELVLVFIVGLVVLGPKRLPIAIRTVMGWVRTIRGLAANVQNELAQELKLQELQESIKKAEELNLSKLSPELGKTVEDLKQSAQKMQADLNTAQQQFRHINSTEADEKAVEAKSSELSEALKQADLQENAENKPLVDEPAVADSNTLSPAEVAELAEEDVQKLMAYYPPDDDFTQPEQDKKNVG